MLRVLVAEQGEIDDLRRTIGDIREQAQQAQALFAQHAAYISATGGTFPERRHLFGLANTFMIGHYQHMADWAEWAMAQTAEWPDAASPASDDAQAQAMLEAGRRIAETVTGNPEVV